MPVPDITYVINISVGQAFTPPDPPPPEGRYSDIAFANIPNGYAIEFIGTPPPEWYLSASPLSFTSIDPISLTRLTYVPDPPDDTLPNITPSFLYEGVANSVLPPGNSLPGVTIPPNLGFPNQPGGPDEMMAIIGNIVPPIAPIVADLNNQLDAIQGGGGGGGGPGFPGILPPIIGNITGQLDNALDAAIALPGRIPGRIGDQLVSAMGEVYGAGIGLGIDVPTVDDIIAGNVGFQFGPVGNTGFGGGGPEIPEGFRPVETPRPGVIPGFGIVGDGGFGGIGGGVVLPPRPGPAPVIPPIPIPGRPVGVIPPLPGQFEARVNIVEGPIGPQQAGRPVPGGAFANAPAGIPLPPPGGGGGGGGGVVGFPIGGGGGGGGGGGDPGFYPPGSYPPGSYPPGSYSPGSYPTAGDYNYEGGDYNYQGGDYNYEGGDYAPVITTTSIDNSVSTTTTTYEGNTSTSTTTTTTTNTAPTPAPEPAPEPDNAPKKDKEEEKKIPKPAPLAIPPINLAPNPTMWELGAACGFPASPGKFDSRLLWALFGWTNVGGNEYKPPEWLNPANYPFGSQWIGSALMNTFGLGIQTLNKASQASQPITNNFQDFMVLAMGGVVEKWIGAPILPFLQGTIYNINYNNPQLLPGIPDLQNLFRKGAISEEIFRCLVRANGSYDTWQMKIAESSTLVPSLFDIIRLYRGKKIGGNEFEYYANLNGLKIATQQGKQDIATFLEATRAIPGVADLVRMMVRDAADDKIAAKYGTDTDLGNKFAGQIEGWSEQQGVDPEIMKYYWRAHWEIPSNTQLLDMLHKLRPNRRVGVVPANIVTTADDVKQAIQVNDLTPYWVDRVMATSYSPLTRIDAQRAFFIEAITEDQLFDAYMDIGYNSDNAQVLVDFTKELKRKRDANLPGADKPANIISQLKKYVISETNAYDRLIATGMKPQKAKQAVANSVRDRKEEARVKCLKEAQRRFFRAEYDLLKYKSVVMQLGIPQENIEALVNETACLYDSRGKELNAGALCKAFKQNIIAFDQFQNRLNLIGYNKDEAYIIAESCQIDKVVAIGKAKLAQEVKEKAEAEKARKAAEKAAKEAAKKPKPT